MTRVKVSYSMNPIQSYCTYAMNHFVKNPLNQFPKILLEHDIGACTVFDSTWTL